MNSVFTFRENTNDFHIQYYIDTIDIYYVNVKMFSHKADLQDLPLRDSTYMTYNIKRDASTVHG